MKKVSEIENFKSAIKKMSLLQWESAGLWPGDLWVEGEDLTQGLYQPRTQIPLPQALQWKTGRRT